MIIGCVQWNLVYGWEDFVSGGAQSRDCQISRPELNPLSYLGSFHSLGIFQISHLRCMSTPLFFPNFDFCDFLFMSPEWCLLFNSIALRKAKIVYKEYKGTRYKGKKSKFFP